MTDPFTGSGPGIQTPDGCSVEFYRRLPYMGELDELLPLLPPGGAVLELGCGTGRLCRRLAEAGFEVTGVDESADMLAALPPGVAGVRSTIQALNLPRRFDAVLLASHLINHPDTAVRDAFIACARRHLTAGGLFLAQRHDPQWLRTAQPGRAGSVGGIAIHVEQVARGLEGGPVGMTLRCEREDDPAAEPWRQSFTTVPLEVDEIEAMLRAAGFSGMAWYGARQGWFSAVAMEENSPIP